MKTMHVNEIVKYFKTHPWAFTTGKGNLAKRLKCRPEDIVEARRLFKGKNTNKLPKILVLDIETSPMKAYVWKRWKENISLDQTISEWFCLSWSASWLDSDYMMSNVLTKEEVLKEDDSRIIESLRNLLDEAEIVIAHNGKHFDLPKINSRCIVNNIDPPSSYIIIDTLKEAQKTFGFSSNKLDALATYFGIPNKLETDFNLWKACMEGDVDSLKRMEEYNRQDVYILKDVYLKMRPWIKNHPNIGNIINESNVCPVCGCSHLNLIKDKYYYTSVNRYQLYRCDNCHTVLRSRKAIAESNVSTISTAH